MAQFGGAATAIAGHLLAIKSKRAASSYGKQIGELANVLEGLLNDDVVARMDPR